MRRILVENARRKKRLRHGGDVQRRPLLDEDVLVEQPDDRLLLLDAALSKLLEEKPAIGQLVKLRYFGGLTTDEAARALDVSPRTAKRYWAYAKAWLRRELDRALEETQE
jgi:RNA polymerase sigma factor (TIGR02999 family)